MPCLELANPDWKLAVRLSPPEPWYALVNTVATAVRMSLSDNILRGWKNVLLTISACIEDIPPGDARFWRAQSLRQELIESGDVAKLTLREMILECAGFKFDKEKELGRTLSSLTVAKFVKTM